MLASAIERRDDAGATDRRVDVSVVVSTYNRCIVLPHALDSLLEQDASRVEYEVVVVDNNSGDATREVVDAVRARAAGRVRYVFEREQGVSHARNRGFRAARAPIVAFTDDDVQPARDWVRRIKDVFDEHPDADAVGGRIIPGKSAPWPAWLTADHWPPLGLVDYGPHPIDMRDTVLCLVSANVAFRRRAFERIGGFPSKLQRVRDGIGSAEDVEMSTRLWRAGARLRYVPDLVVVADIAPERLTKRYHRAWHRGRGRFLSLMGEPGGRRLLGVPLYVYRHAMQAVGGLAVSLARGDAGRAFAHEVHLCCIGSYVAARLGSRRRGVA